MKETRRFQPFAAHVLCLGLAAAAFGFPSHALNLGHSRIVSAAGDPLLLHIPLSQVSASDSESLKIALASSPDWHEAGLQPPFPLSQIQIEIQRDALGLAQRVLIRSEGHFTAPLLDILLDITTASGQERRHISVLQSHVPGVSLSPIPFQGGAGSPALTDTLAHPSTVNDKIRVVRGDTLWALAHAHRQDGISVYQWMLAVYEANPHAFINADIHRLKYAAELRLPSSRQMRLLSGAQARAQFAAFTAGVSSPLQKGEAKSSSADQGKVEMQAEQRPEIIEQRNRLVLQQSQADGQLDKQTQVQQGIRETGERISQLEESVHNLNLALQSQGNNALTDLVLQGAGILGTASDANSALPALKSADADAGKVISMTQPASPLLAAAQGEPNTQLTDEARSPEPAAKLQPHLPDNKAQKVVRKVSWIQENMLAVMGTLLALIVFIIALVLRRANSSNRELDDAPAPVSEAMVREKLAQINLDLDQPPSDEPSHRI